MGFYFLAAGALFLGLLVGRLSRTKVVDNYVPGPTGWLNIYAVEWEQPYLGRHGVGVRRLKEYFYSCEQAHTTHPGKPVTIAIAGESDGSVFLVAKLEKVQVEPRPKVAKGRK